MPEESKEDKENRKIGVFEVLKELAIKIKSEIFLLAFAFGLIIALVAITAPHLSLSISAPFIALYSIAVIAYFALKVRETNVEVKKKTHDQIRWKMEFPSAFQNPVVVMKERPELTIVRFEIVLKLTNKSQKSLKACFYVCSLSQAVIFVWDEPREIWKRKFGFIPYRREFESALDNWETQSIAPNQTGVFTFHGIHRPRRAFDDHSLRKSVVIKYRISAASEDDALIKTSFDTGFKKLEIPFKDKIEYDSEKEVSEDTQT